MSNRIFINLINNGHVMFTIDSHHKSGKNRFFYTCPLYGSYKDGTPKPSSNSTGLNTKGMPTNKSVTEAAKVTVNKVRQTIEYFDTLSLSLRDFNLAVYKEDIMFRLFRFKRYESIDGLINHINMKKYESGINVTTNKIKKVLNNDKK